MAVRGGSRESLTRAMVMTAESDAGRPLLLHLAHFNPKEKHLETYRKLFRSLGCDVVTLKSNPVDIWRPKQGERRVEAIFERLRELAGGGRPIFIACFSGASKTIYWPLMNALRDEEVLASQIAGVLFDSCPVEFKAREGLSFFHQALQRAPLGLSTLVFPFLRLFSFGLDTLMSAEWDRQHQRYWRDISSPPFDAKVVVLYSARDPIVRAETVRKFADNLRARRNCIECIEFGKSSHVDHLVFHEQAYASAVERLIRPPSNL